MNKLSDTQVKRIKRLYKNQVPLPRIAELVGVSMSSVYRHTGYISDSFIVSGPDEYGTPSPQKCQLSIKNCNVCKKIFEETCTIGSSRI